MDDSAFETLADGTLQALMDAIEEALGDYLEVDLQNGILTIEVDGGGEYVINKHGPNRQIWMSSPVSGASHFDHDDEMGWVSTRGGGRLAVILADELSAATGEEVDADDLGID